MLGTCTTESLRKELLSYAWMSPRATVDAVALNRLLEGNLWEASVTPERMLRYLSDVFVPAMVGVGMPRLGNVRLVRWQSGWPTFGFQPKYDGSRLMDVDFAFRPCEVTYRVTAVHGDPAAASVLSQGLFVRLARMARALHMTLSATIGDLVGPSPVWLTKASATAEKGLFLDSLLDTAQLDVMADAYDALNGEAIDLEEIPALLVEWRGAPGVLTLQDVAAHWEKVKVQRVVVTPTGGVA